MHKQGVIGFGGRAESGKTTAANMLLEIAQPDGHKHIEFSDPILLTAQQWLDGADLERIDDVDYWTRLLAQILNENAATDITRSFDAISELPIDKLYKRNLLDGNIDAVVSRETKPSHRPLLEWLGYRAIQLTSPTVWGDAVRDKIAHAKSTNVELVTIGGVRSKADKTVVQEMGGKVIRLHRTDPAILRLTETQLHDWQADYELDNNGTIDELYEKISTTWDELSTKDH